MYFRPGTYYLAHNNCKVKVLAPVGTDRVQVEYWTEGFGGGYPTRVRTIACSELTCSWNEHCRCRSQVASLAGRLG